MRPDGDGGAPARAARETGRRSACSGPMVALALLVAAGGCDFGVGGAEGGCARVHQGSYEMPVKRIIKDAVAVRLTQHGTDFVTERIRELMFALFEVDAQGRAIIPLADLGVGSLSTSLGPLQAEVRDLVLLLDLAALQIRFVPGSSPPRLQIRLDDAVIGLQSGVVAGVMDTFLFSGDVACAMANGPQGHVARLDLVTEIELATTPEGLLDARMLPSTVNLHDVSLRLLVDCTLPECLDGLQPPSTAECSECEIICPAGDLVSAMASLLQALFTDLVDALLGAVAHGVANIFLDGFLNGRPLAIEGALDLATFLGPALRWMETAEPLGILGRPGANAFRVTGAGPTLGLDLVLDAGADAAPSHPCVGSHGPDGAFASGPRPTFDGLVSLPGIGAVPYDLGVGLSDAIVNEAIWALYKAGALCIDLTTEELAVASGGSLLLTARTLDLLLPGVSGVAGPEAPVRLRLRPSFPRGHEPVVQFGVEPLIGVRLEGAQVAVDVLVGDQFTRVVGFEADLALGLALDAMPGGALAVRVDGITLDRLVLIGDELFREARLDIIAPFVVDLALGFLASSPITFDLPTDGLTDGLGVPIVPVVRGIAPAGPLEDWLALYIAFEDPAPVQPLRALAITLDEVAPGSLVFRAELTPGEAAQLRVAGGHWSRWYEGPGPHVHDDPRLFLVGTWPVEVRHRAAGGLPGPAVHAGWVPISADRLLPPALEARPWQVASPSAAAPTAPETPSPAEPAALEGCSAAGGLAWPALLWSLLALLGLAIYVRRRRRCGSGG